MDPLDLIPRPAVLREALARNIGEARVLRSLLRLSVRAAEIRTGKAISRDFDATSGDGSRAPRG